MFACFSNSCSFYCYCCVGGVGLVLVVGSGNVALVWMMEVVGGRGGSKTSRFCALDRSLWCIASLLWQFFLLRTDVAMTLQDTCVTCVVLL